MPGNTTLVPYGIGCDMSDWRAHVSFASHHVYAYLTANVRAMDLSRFPKRPAMTGETVTAMGYLVPTDEIPGLYCVPIPEAIWTHRQPFDNESTSNKGAAAVLVVKDLMNGGHMPFLYRLVEIKDVRRQRDGADLEVKAGIQVKCDWHAGPRKLGGTGNLFIQVEECNPHRQH